MTFTEVNQASRPTRDMLLVRNLGPAGGCRSEPAGVSGEWERTRRRTRQSTHSGVNPASGSARVAGHARARTAV